MNSDDFAIHRRETTASTNADARSGRPGDVFVAEFQTAGRGRLGHEWHAARGENLTFSVVLDAAGAAPAEVATLPLAAGLAVARSVCAFLGKAAPDVAVKWPNDVLVGGRKVCGILCERNGDSVVVGIGLNVNQTAFPAEIAARATSMSLAAGRAFDRDDVLRDVVGRLGEIHSLWRRGTFAALRDGFAAFDCLKGREVAVLATDGDDAPLKGLCGGVQADGSLLVGETKVYAGEAHVAEAGGLAPPAPFMV
jgi:BirA family biotin operon repressor/biotin-[acetyl-CoA-carboxylase] ligase